MRRPQLIAPTLLFAVAGVAILGCGGGRDQVSAAELVQKGDQICREERSSFDRIQAHPPPNASVAADQTKELIQATEDANAKLRDLEPPAELQPRYDQYLDARDRAVDEMKRGKDAAENEDSDAYGAAQAAVARDAKQRRKLAGSLGLRVCSASPAAA